MEYIEITLPSSKSIHNRIQIIHALIGLKNSIKNPSDATDCVELQACLESDERELHIGNGGTSLRFLLSYLCFKQKLKTLFCGDSLKSRPLKPLLLALEKMGCEFEYLEMPFQLPLKIKRGINLDFNEILEIDMNQSSQFVSALALIGPMMNNGLQLQIGTQRTSESYLKMSLELMASHGAFYQLTEKHLIIKSSLYNQRIYEVEADWSAAAGFFAWLALQENHSLFFPRLKTSGLQGDEKILDFLNDFGIQFKVNEKGLLLTKNVCKNISFIEFDLKDCPDLFPVLAILCALKKITVRFIHVQNLLYKESNRLKVISDFLKSCHVDISLNSEDPLNWIIEYKSDQFKIEEGLQLDTFNDHRIAMAYSLLPEENAIEIKDKEVVEKSFPKFWIEFSKLKKNQP